MSKSRGISAAGKTARASARTSRGAWRVERWVSASIRTSRVARGLRGLARGRVFGLARTLGLLLGERGLVHEHVGAVGGDDERLARRGVAGEHELAPEPRRAHHLLGAHPADALAALQAAEVRARRDPELLRDRGVELPRPGLLDERVPERAAAAVAHGDRS